MIERGEDLDGWRVYKVDGQTYYSVTKVLDFFVDEKLKNWFVKTSPKEIEKKRTETANQGSDLHSASQSGIEERLNKLMDEMGIEERRNEEPTYSKNGWAGTFDKIVRYQGKNYLIDIKTGRFGHVALQLAAYTLALNEHGANIEGNAVISLPRNLEEPATFWEYSEHREQNEYAWCAAFDVWKHHYFKKLKEQPWFERKTVLSYNWSFGGDE